MPAAPPVPEAPDVPTATDDRSAYEQLRDALIVGEFQPGEPLREALISARIGMSRTPVREALRQLEAEGLVTRSGRSYAIRVATPAEILDIYEVRIALEAAAARGAATRHDEIDLARLRDAVIAPPLAERTDENRNFAANDRFHDLVRSAAHNTSLNGFLRSVLTQITLLDKIPVANADVIEQTYAEHGEIVDAIAAHDAQRAAQLMTDHLNRTRDLRLRAIVAQDSSAAGAATHAARTDNPGR